MNEIAKKLLTLAKEGTTVQDIEGVLKEGLPGLRTAALEGLNKKDAAELIESTPSLRAARDEANSRAIQTWRENHLNTEIEKEVAKRTPLTSINDVKERLKNESDPTQRSILESKLEALQAREEMAQFKREQEEATKKARRESLRAAATRATAGKLPEGHESILDSLIGDDEETTQANIDGLLKLTDTVKKSTFNELAKQYNIQPGASDNSGDSGENTMARGEFEKMNPERRMQFIKQGGQVTSG